MALKERQILFTMSLPSISSDRRNPVLAAAGLQKDTVLVAPGERYDVVWTARRKGKCLLHCHINHHITNDGEETDGAGAHRGKR
ncbi:MAG: multicopper oxidase domain-containing protein [Candidatus Eremiobacteraeota bacterium]|nr:multicopper oxidase domain-containing protein [Candidatus Eremiobacteraeota bacterium]